jgi:hypothetical protein
MKIHRLNGDYYNGLNIYYDQNNSVKIYTKNGKIIKIRSYEGVYTHQFIIEVKKFIDNLPKPIYKCFTDYMTDDEIKKYKNILESYNRKVVK